MKNQKIRSMKVHEQSGYNYKATARLASSLPYIDKVLFVVDRKDLDYQTMKEYDRFEKGAANSNSSTAILERQLRGTKEKIIIIHGEYISGG